MRSARSRGWSILPGSPPGRGVLSMKQLAVAFLFVAAWALPFAPVVATAPSEPDVEVEAIINDQRASFGSLEK